MIFNGHGQRNQPQKVICSMENQRPNSSPCESRPYGGISIPTSFARIAFDHACGPSSVAGPRVPGSSEVGVREAREGRALAQVRRCCGLDWGTGAKSVERVGLEMS